jgi:predicted CopG family antitoxin
MRTTVDIPDPVYRELKSQAAMEGRSVKDLILRRVVRPAQNAAVQRKKIKFPAIKAKNPGSLKLGREGVYEYIPFP